MAAEYTEKQKEQRRKAVADFMKTVDRVNCQFPLGTKERIKKLTGKSCNAFIKETIVKELKKLEKKQEENKMKWNTIILLKGENALTKIEMKKFNKGDTIWGEDENPIEIKRWNSSELDTAKAELKKFQCEYRQGIELFYITEYALEFCNTDYDGDFLEGADFELAEE